MYTFSTKIKIVIFIVLFVGAVALGFYWQKHKTAPHIGNELEKSDLIHLEHPRPNEVVRSPLTIRGQARGSWFFEASFPARLIDANGTEIAALPVMARGDWMTSDFVPFEATINFPTPTTKTGTLILQKDNPSGLPEHEDSLMVPVTF